MASVILIVFCVTPVVAGDEPPLSESDQAWLEEAEAVLRQPVDVNAASYDELLQIPWLSPRVAKAIISFRDSLGGSFSSRAQLAQVKGIDDATLAALLVKTPDSVVRRWAAGFRTGTRLDSVAGGVRQAAGLARFDWRSPVLRSVFQIEKDAGEPELTDFIGCGLEYRLTKATVVVGDYTMTGGTGLVLASPRARSRYAVRSGDFPAGPRMASSVQETRLLRGAGVRFRWGRAGAGVAVSAAQRDARLDEHGAVRRFSSGGVHVDSAARAEKGQVVEWHGALAAECQFAAWQLGGTATVLRFSRPVQPVDTQRDFAGSSLAVGSFWAGSATGNYRLATELAAASTGGLALAATLDRDFADRFDVTAKFRWRSQQYFAPHGCWTTLAAVERQTTVSGRFRFRLKPVQIVVNANTRRTGEDDSLPGRIELVLEQRGGNGQVELRLGRSYEGEQERLTTAGFGFTWQAWRVLSGRLRVGYKSDVLRKLDGGVLAGIVRADLGPVRVSLAATRFHIPRGGVTLSWSEPAAFRDGTVFSSRQSCWRTAATVAFRIGVIQATFGGVVEPGNSRSRGVSFQLEAREHGH